MKKILLSLLAITMCCVACTQAPKETSERIKEIERQARYPQVTTPFQLKTTQADSTLTELRNHLDALLKTNEEFRATQEQLHQLMKTMDEQYTNNVPKLQFDKKPLLEPGGAKLKKTN